MLIKLLSDEDKKHLLELAKLLAVSDKPLLWDGKPSDELTSSTNLDALSIQEGEQERELIADLEVSAGVNQSGLYAFAFASAFSSSSGVHERLIEVLKTYPITKVEKPESRVEAATTVLRELLKEKTFELPTAPKVILFELLLVALRDGHISSIEWALLKEYQLHHQLDDFIFDDLLERAEALNQEVSKTIAIILE
jgi:hypothetical protein